MNGPATVCVVGSFMYDVVATAPRRPEPGETLVGTSLATYVGGKGFNQAVAASRAGGSVAMVGRIGLDSFGNEFQTALKDDDISATHVISDPDHGTGVGLPVVLANGQNSIIIVPRANLAVSVADIEAAAAQIVEASVLLLQLELPAAPTMAAARIAHQAGVTVILNPAPFAEPSPELQKYVDILVPNEGELRALAHHADRDGAAEVSAMARSVARTWDAKVVVTLGERGVMAVPGDGPAFSVPAHAVEVVDTIGAGDVFCGNLGARLALGDSLEDAVCFGNAASSLAVTRRGGAPSAPLAHETEAMIGRSTIEVARS
ncbi:MAG: ribokinase [Actinobacteria bacterium]|nr:ribokinase [Actinomycetota bacterium]